MVINLQARYGSKQYHFDVICFLFLAEKLLKHDIDHEQFKPESGNMYVKKMQEERGLLFFPNIFINVEKLYEVVAYELAFSFFNRNTFPDYGERYKDVVCNGLVDGIYKFSVRDSDVLISVFFNEKNNSITIICNKESRSIFTDKLNNQFVSIDDEIIDSKQAIINNNESYPFRSATRLDVRFGGVPIGILRHKILLNEEFDLPGNKKLDSFMSLLVSEVTGHDDCDQDISDKYDVLKHEDNDELKEFLLELFYGVDIDKLVSNLINTFDKEKALLIKERTNIISDIIKEA
ncbi:MAG: hypothetical protein COV57_01900 [Candidatus Liptonbacteria bacterium CG11_big_fil_rev_8_21_14_0_20_35_14]|uniref:Uncharacterized protein n=1 Tax=Candidatus Liptonbacteria bacterium CG11_big_fil_rev_8_21_14_0_20_35_14 TaxID=1974634 RepID=A0A2H0N9Y1_9BACT|nr:MAG: hypothetical protein COV57_01900 [Candidatus Liptonbacteria bacterium CG11_big_fil_rev_8_21_14_0_20_35_14]